ncbi:MAG TPA: hypothetical protein VJB88_14375 [Vicinamibacteria bacterium]|nr:hypothetical protein [Vicinamibacteria bacterium]
MRRKIRCLILNAYGSFMASRDGKALAGFLIVSALLAIFGLVYVFLQIIEFGRANLESTGPPLPDHLREIRVVEDRLGLTKTTFLSYQAGCTTITDIATGDFHEDPGEEVLLIDCQQAQVVDVAGQPMRSIRFAKPLRFPKIHRTGKGFDDWIAVDEGVWDELKAVVASGEILWSRSAAGNYSGVATGNLDEDPLPEFVVWRHEQPGLEVLDHDGAVLRPLGTADAVKAVVILEGVNPQEARICYSILDRELVFLDVHGNVVSRRKPDAPALNFIFPFEWPELSSRKIFLQTFWDSLNFLTFDGEKVATFHCPSLRNQLLWVPVRLATVRFPERTGSYLVVVDRLYYHSRTVLQVYEPSGALVYHEILEGMYGGLGVIPDESGRATSILLGGSAQVLRYSLASGAVNVRRAQRFARPTTAKL